MALNATQLKAQSWAVRLNQVIANKQKKEVYRWRQHRACTLRKGDRILLDNLIYLVTLTAPNDGNIEVWLSRKNKVYRCFLASSALVTKDLEGYYE